MCADRSVTLYNGVSMPMLGLGTSHHGGYVHSSVLHAIKQCGYRLIDTAQRYHINIAVIKNSCQKII